MAEENGKGDGVIESGDGDEVDLFIDLSVADTVAAWSLYGSSLGSLHDPQAEGMLTNYFTQEELYVDSENPNSAWTGGSSRQKEYDV